MDQGIHPESDKAAQRNWFRPFRGPFSLEVGWPRNGSTESARDAGLNTCLREKLRAIAAPSADARLHMVGSVFRAVPGAGPEIQDCVSESGEVLMIRFIAEYEDGSTEPFDVYWSDLRTGDHVARIIAGERQRDLSGFQRSSRERSRGFTAIRRSPICPRHE